MLLADCSTKQLAITVLEPHTPRPIAGEFLRFTLAFNPGAALSISLGGYSRPIFSLLAVLAVVLLVRLYYLTAPGAALRAAAIALVVGGALGNLLDRVRSARGVVDFIDIGIGDLRFWTFNLADVGVTLGALLLAWTLGRAPQPAARGPAGSGT